MKRCIFVGDPKEGETPIIVSADHERTAKELAILASKGITTTLECIE